MNYVPVYIKDIAIVVISVIFQGAKKKIQILFTKEYLHKRVARYFAPCKIRPRSRSGDGNITT